jgi:hypothetical protein
MIDDWGGSVVVLIHELRSSFYICSKFSCHSHIVCTHAILSHLRFSFNNDAMYAEMRYETR